MLRESLALPAPIDNYDDDSDCSADIPLARLAMKWSVEEIVDVDLIKKEQRWGLSCELVDTKFNDESQSCNSYYFIAFHDQQNGTNCNMCSSVIRCFNFVNTSKGDLMLGCDVCPAYFLGPCDLITHKMGYHFRTIEYQCKTCMHLLNSVSDLSDHVKIHDNAMPGCKICIDQQYMCVYCSHTFNSNDLLVEHLKMHSHNHMCGKCFKEFYELDDFKHHLKEQTNCPHCRMFLCDDLIGHLQQVHPEKLCKCLHCETNFVDSARLEEHVLAMHCNHSDVDMKLDLQYSDQENSDAFSSEDNKEKLRNESEFVHSKIRPGRRRKKLMRKRRRMQRKSMVKEEMDEPYECNSCGKTYLKKDHLRIHMYNHFKPLSCPICHQLFAFKTYLRNHIATHTGEKRFLCHLCGANFTQYGNLQSHLKRHAGNKRFHCAYCPKSFFLMGALKKHVRIHTGDKPYKCPFCDKSFSSSGNMARHKMIHTGEKPYHCTYCSKSFIQSTELKNHLRTHTGEPRPVRPISGKKFTCNQCNKNFTTSAYLKAHIRVHTGERPYKCNVCDKTFAKISSFSQHRKIHLDVKPYICSYCGKGFSQSGNFTMHLRRHTGEKPYKCETCSKCFSQPVNLTRHRMVHTGERPFACPHCSKKFSQAHALADHINVHTGQKPHKCAYCGSSFANQSTLSRHMVSHSHHVYMKTDDLSPIISSDIMCNVENQV